MQGRNKVLDLMKLIYMFPIVFVHANYLIDTTYNWKTDAIFSQVVMLLLSSSLL